MERRRKGTIAYKMKSSTFKNKILEQNVDVDALMDEEREKLETTAVKKPKWYNVAEKLKVAKLNRKARKRYSQ